MIIKQKFEKEKEINFLRFVLEFTTLQVLTMWPFDAIALFLKI